MKTRKTKIELNKVRNEIRRYLTLGATTTKIKEYLKLADRTFDRHLQAIYEEDKKTLVKERSDLLSTTILQTKDRLLRIIENCERIAHDDNTSARDKLEAERLKKETSIALIRLLRDAPTQIMIDYEHNTESKPTNVREQLSKS